MKTRHICALLGCLGMVPATALAADGVIVGIEQEPPHLDPTSAGAGAIDQVLYGNVYEGLTRFGPNGEVMPGLAESWTVSGSGTEYIFRLRDVVTFHEGTTLDARDVQFTLERARDDDSQNAQKSLFDGIDAIEVLGDRVIKVTLAEAQGDFLFNLAWGDAVILGPESIGEIKQHPIGTGAFRFREWVAGEQIVLERYDEYWGEPAKLETATFRFIDEPDAASAALQAGDIDVFPAFPSLQNLPEFDADPQFQVLVGSTESETILAMNNKRPPMDNPLVRRAIAHAIDRQALIEKGMFGLGMPIGTHFAPHRPEYLDLTGISTYDPALSVQLLAEAGQEAGFAVTLKLPPPDYLRRCAEILASQLRDVGIEVEIITLSWPEWTEQVFQEKDFDLTVVSHNEPLDIGIYADPDYYFQYEGIAFQAVMQELKAVSNATKRRDWLAAAQKLIADDYVNAFLFQLPAVTVANARLRGLWRNAPVQATDLTGAYWEN